MKFAKGEFTITKKIDENIRHKRSTFQEETKTTHAIHVTMITTYGVKHNLYWGQIQSEVTVNDLFK
jgi:hypothetical protein